MPNTPSPRKPQIERAERYPFNQEVLVSSFGARDRIKVLCVNISASGFLITSPNLPFQIGSLIELHLYSMDQQQSIKLTGKVARTKLMDNGQSEYGVHFSFQDHRELVLWGEYMSILATPSSS